MAELTGARVGAQGFTNGATAACTTANGGTARSMGKVRAGKGAAEGWGNERGSDWAGAGRDGRL
jgi:hypothetical protein